MFFITGLFYSFGSNAADCVTHRGGYYHETYAAELKYYTFHGAPLDGCQEIILLTSAEYALLKSYEDELTLFTAITGEMASASFMFGMSGYLLFWFIGYKARMAKQLVKSV
jgi:hypothetical protein